MPIYQPFFKRQQALRGEFPDVYQYETLPEKARNQLIWFMNHYVGDQIKYHQSGSVQNKYASIRNIMCEELGKMKLFTSQTKSLDKYDEVIYFIKSSSSDIEHVLSILEIAIRMLKLTGSLYTEAIETFNTRLKENGIGYCFE